MKRTIFFGFMFVMLMTLTYSTRVSGTHVWFFDIGQGDAALMQWGSAEVMVDGGPDARTIEKLGSAMSLWDREIQMMILTHPDADHVVGLLEIFNRYRVRFFMTSAWVKASNETVALQERVLRSRTATTIHDQRDRILAMPQGWTAVIPALPPSAQTTNDRSVVILLTNGKIRMLWMGDASAFVETYLLQHYPEFFPVQILKIGHHGSCTSSSESFLNAAAPRYAVISVGADNRYGHPCLKVLERLQQLPTEILRTDQWGDIHFIVKQDRLVLQPFRK